MASKTLLSAFLLFSLLGCGLCWWPGRHGMMAPSWPKLPPFKPDVEVMENPIVCEACTFVVEELQKILGNDSSKIINLLDELCGELPAEYVSTCKEYVDQWTPIIVDFLENQTPKEICSDLTLCSAAVETEPVEPSLTGFSRLMRYLKARAFNHRLDDLMLRRSLGNDFLCDGCNEVVNFLARELTNPMLWNELVTLLSETCSLCPVPDQCRAFFKGLPAQVTALVDEFLNNQTCTCLGLCTTSDRENPTDMFGRLVDAFLSGDMNMDMMFGGRRRPFSRPSPRPHPFRGWFKPFFWSGHRHHEHENGHHGHDRPDQESSNTTDTMRNSTRPEGGKHHNHGHNRGEDSHERHDHPGRPDRPGHGRRPGGRDPDRHPHKGPIHGFLPREDDFPRPDVRPWWRPAKPFKPRPWGGKPALPEEPMVPEMEVPEVPDFEIPEADVPEVQIPEVDVPELPTLDFEPVAELTYPAPKKPFGFDGRKPTMNGPWKNREVSWSKKKWSRKQRSIRIETELNTGDFDPTHIFDVEPAQEPVEETVTEVAERTWQCDACEYEMEIVQTYLKSHQDAIEEKLMSLANTFCEKLPESTTDECKAEMQDVVPTLVEMGIEKLSADFVCTDIFKIC